MTMGELATNLKSRTDRPVLDKTGLTGLYQFTIELPALREGVRAMQRLGITTTHDGRPINPDPPGVSVFTAAKSIGLKLESRRSPVDIVVIDKIARNPTED